jgi:tRNA (cytidine/uridine-2'-O-)-methyltransferase
MPNLGIVLFNPEIPPNTGNIIRLCANTGSELNIIKPIGFQMDEKSLRRAGLDYFKIIKTIFYENIDEFLEFDKYKRYFLVSKYGTKSYDQFKYNKGDCFIFGSETKGLSHDVFKKFKKSPKIYIPMTSKSRSLNLANSVAICVYEALRQNKFQFL